MIGNFQIVQGSTLPWLEVQITKNGILPMGPQWPQYTCNPGKPDPNVVDLTDAERVDFMMWKCGRTPLAVGLSGNPCTLGDEAQKKNGIVTYKWVKPDTDVAGLFYGRFRVLFKDNTVFEWPFQLEALTIEIIGPSTPVTM